MKKFNKNFCKKIRNNNVIKITTKFAKFALKFFMLFLLIAFKIQRAQAVTNSPRCSSSSQTVVEPYHVGQIKSFNFDKIFYKNELNLVPVSTFLSFLRQSLNFLKRGGFYTNEIQLIELTVFAQLFNVMFKWIATIFLMSRVKKLIKLRGGYNIKKHEFNNNEKNETAETYPKVKKNFRRNLILITGIIFILLLALGVLFYYYSKALNKIFDLEEQVTKIQKELRESLIFMSEMDDCKQGFSEALNLVKWFRFLLQFTGATYDEKEALLAFKKALKEKKI